MTLYTPATDLQPGDLVYMHGQQRTVKSIQRNGKLLEVWTEEDDTPRLFFPDAEMKYV